LTAQRPPLESVQYSYGRSDPFEALQDRQTQAAFFSSSGPGNAPGMRWSRIRSPARPQERHRWKSLRSVTYS